MSLVTRLIYARNRRGVGRLCKELLALYGVEVPSAVQIGPGLSVEHRGFGLVIHPDTTIGENVTIYHGVTIGRATPWASTADDKMERIVIEDEAMLCPGSKVICKEGVLRVGRGTVLGANAVLTTSTGDGEIWAGAPARKVGVRPNYTFGLLVNDR